MAKKDNINKGPEPEEKSSSEGSAKGSEESTSSDSSARTDNDSNVSNPNVSREDINAQQEIEPGNDAPVETQRTGNSVNIGEGTADEATARATSEGESLNTQSSSNDNDIELTTPDKTTAEPPEMDKVSAGNFDETGQQQSEEAKSAKTEKSSSESADTAAGISGATSETTKPNITSGGEGENIENPDASDAEGAETADDDTINVATDTELDEGGEQNIAPPEDNNFSVAEPTPATTFNPQEGTDANSPDTTSSPNISGSPTGNTPESASQSDPLNTIDSLDPEFVPPEILNSTDEGDTTTPPANEPPSDPSIADTPNLSVEDATGAEGATSIPLSISAALTDTDGSESLAITISGVPDGATLNGATNNGDGTYTVTDVENLSISMGEHFDGSFELSVSATATDGSDTNTVSGNIAVSVSSELDTGISISNVSGSEDTAIPLSISFSDNGDSDETVTAITISGVPDGATLSAGTDNGDGSYTLAVADLDGLTLTPADDSDADFSLSVSATVDENGTSYDLSSDIDVTVNAVADAPDLSVDDASGVEGGAIALDISAALTDTDNSESLSIVVSGVPDGATLSKGTDNGDGTWTLAAADLSELTITPNENFDGSFNLTVTATSEEADGGDTNIVTGNIAVTVSPEVDTSISISSIGGGEDTDIPLSISFNDNGDSDESVTAVTISGVPDGATLSAGTDNGDGSWTLTPAQLENLTITPPDDSGSDMNLSVSATVDENGTSYDLSSDIDVTVNAVADAPDLSVNDASGVEGGAIALDISAAAD